MIQKTQCRSEKRKRPLPALIEVGHAEPKPDVRPCEWCLAERPNVAGQGPNDSEAVAGSRLNPWGHVEAYPVRESCHANSEKPIACPGQGYKQGSGRERSRRRRK